MRASSLRGKPASGPKGSSGAGSAYERMAVTRLRLATALCAILGASTARAGESVPHQRAAVGRVLHEYDAGGPYLRIDTLIVADDAAFGMGVAVWRGAIDDWGIGSPFVVHAAISGPLRFGLGGGLDLVHVDRLQGRTGVGIFAPLALAELDVSVGGVRLGAEARAEYRWKSFGTGYEQGQLSFGLTVAVPLEEP